MNKRLTSLALFSAVSFLSAPAAARQVDVHMRDFQFSPATVSVAPGDTVRFVNDDQDAHTVTAKDGTFDSKGIDTAQTWTHAFAKRGRYVYFCELHPYMTGVVVVK